MNYYSPVVIEQTAQGEKRYDVWSRLLKDRIIFLGSAIDEDLANVTVAQLLHLEGEDPHKEVTLYINSPGGQVSAGLAIYDAMQYIRCEISTVCIGQASSMAAVLLAAGSKGKRFILPYSRVMIHQPLGGAQGQATDIEIQAKEIIKIKKTLNNILVKHTGKSFKQIERDTDRDFFLSAPDAIKYGLVDKIVTRHENQNVKI